MVGLIDMVRSGWLNNEIDEAAPGFKISGEDVVVDVGSGDGGLGIFCARRARETVLIDNDAARVERAVAKVGQEGGRNVRGLVGDAAALPLPDGLASRVICTEVLEHVDDPAKVMAELVRIGRPGALYLISVPNGPAERLQIGLAWPKYFEKPNHIWIFDPEDFTNLVEDAGLVIENNSVRGFFWTLHWMFFWQANQEFGTSTPLCDAWARTWDLVMKSPQGPQIKAALDGLAGHTNALVARKPG
jgi:SAM-dependent methyltransferase